MLYNLNHKSWLHRVNPALKLFLMLAGMIVILIIQNVNVMFPLTVLLMLFVLFGTKEPKRRVLLFMLPFLFMFISTSASMIFFGKGSTLWWQCGPIAISRESFYRGIHVGFRALCFGLMGLLFTLSTRPVLLFYSLMQQLNLPPKYAYGFMASLRLLPVVVREFRTLRQAYQVKGVQFSKRWNGVLQTIELYAVPLLARSIRRAQRISVAMEVRRFSNQVNRTYYYQVAFSHVDAVMTTCWIAMFVGSWLVGWHFPLVAIKDVRF